jgi:hypothetical protein
VDSKCRESWEGEENGALGLSRVITRLDRYEEEHDAQGRTSLEVIENFKMGEEDVQILPGDP